MYCWELGARGDLRPEDNLDIVVVVAGSTQGLSGTICENLPEERLGTDITVLDRDDFEGSELEPHLPLTQALEESRILYDAQTQEES